MFSFEGSWDRLDTAFYLSSRGPDLWVEGGSWPIGECSGESWYCKGVSLWLISFLGLRLMLEVGQAAILLKPQFCPSRTSPSPSRSSSRASELVRLLDGHSVPERC
jgi:hypothetical protein